MCESFQSRVKRQGIYSTVFLHNFRLRQSSKLTQCHVKSIISDILYLSAMVGSLKLTERKMTCFNLEKCDLSLTPFTEICTENQCTVKHHLLSPLFSSCCTEVSKKEDFFAGQHPSLGWPNQNCFFFRSILITVNKFHTISHPTHGRPHKK